MASNLNTQSKYYTQLTGDMKLRYDAKIQKCGGTDPYSLKQNDLSINSNDFPKISLYDIADYMIHTKSPFTDQFLDNFKGTRAYTYFESGFVISIGSKKNNASSIVKGQVSSNDSYAVPKLRDTFSLKFPNF